MCCASTANSHLTPLRSSQSTHTPKPRTQATLAASHLATVSGALAERGRLIAHLLAAVAFTGAIYPIPVHWVWSAEGWLSARREAHGAVVGSNGVIDLAGSGVVHMAAGVAAFVGAHAVGGRRGRFLAKGGGTPMPPGSTMLLTAGVIMRW